MGEKGLIGLAAIALQYFHTIPTSWAIHKTLYIHTHTQITSTRHSWGNGTRCRDGVKVLWCHSRLVWSVFEGSSPTCTCLSSVNFFVSFHTNITSGYDVMTHVSIADSVELETLPGGSWTILFTFCIFNSNHVNSLCTAMRSIFLG